MGAHGSKPCFWMDGSKAEFGDLNYYIIRGLTFCLPILISQSRQLFSSIAAIKNKQISGIYGPGSLLHLILFAHAESGRKERMSREKHVFVTPGGMCSEFLHEFGD